VTVDEIDAADQPVREADLIRAVRAVSEGKSFFSPVISKMLLEDYVRQVRDKEVEDSYDLLPALLGRARSPVRQAVVHHSNLGMFSIRERKNLSSADAWHSKVTQLLLKYRPGCFAAFAALR
jgi:hypothetical protein